MAMYRRFEIFNDSVESFCKVKAQNISKQEELIKKIHDKGAAIIPHDHEEQKYEFKRIIDSYYI